MTPFGAKLRQMRAARDIKLKDMAKALDVTPAYLSALEHGQRGQPSRYFVRRVCTFFNIIWDDAEDLQRLAEASHPRVRLDTSGLTPAATELANLLAENIGRLDQDDIERLTIAVKRALADRRS